MAKNMAQSFKKSYNTARRQGEALTKWAKRLAKTADQRLVRLEKLSGQEGYNGVKNWAYKNAQLDLEGWGYHENDKPRFNRGLPTVEPEAGSNAETALINKITDMQNFLESATSTKSGIQEHYEKVMETFAVGNDDTHKGGYGTSFTWETLANYYNKGAAEKLSKMYGSKTALVAIGKIQKMAQDKKSELAAEGRGTSNKNILHQMRLDLENSTDVSTNRTDEVVAEILNDRKLGLSNLF